MLSSMRAVVGTKMSEGPMISPVMIMCTRAVSTAIEVESSVFRRLPKLAGRMYCPVCGEEHIWSTGSAWLLGEPRPMDKAPKKVDAA